MERRSLVGALWVALYAAVVLAPLLALLVPPVPRGRGFWTDLSVAFAYSGLAMLVVQFATAARFRRVAAPYGIDIILQFHRWTALGATALILAHPLILFAVSPWTRGLLDVLSAPWSARAGVAALVLLLALATASLWRTRLRLSYEAWRYTHGLAAVLVVALALYHVVGSGTYVHEPWKRTTWAGMGVAAVLLLGWIRIGRPALLVRRPWRVEEVRAERGRTWTLRLRPEGHAGLRFAPGQFAWLSLGRSPFALREHPFTVSSSAERPDAVEFTIKELGDFTRTVKDAAPGTFAYVDGPYGAFSPDRHRRARGFVLLAGGVGITPFMSVLRTFADRGERRPVLLLYASNRWDDVTFREEIEALRPRLDAKVVHVLREPPEDWRGERGYVDRDLLARHLPRDRTGWLFLVCGPPPMMEMVEKALLDLGVPLRNVRVERFDLV